MGTFAKTVAKALAQLDTETITIVRKVKSPSDPTITTDTQIYSGAADVQYDSGTLSYSPSGEVSMYDATACISADADGNLAAVQNDDVLTVNGQAFTVVNVAPWTFGTSHLEIKLKRGPLPYSQPRR